MMKRVYLWIILGLLIFLVVSNTKKMASAGEVVIRLRCVPMENFVKYQKEFQNLLIFYSTIEVPVVFTITDQKISYQREDGRGYHAQGARVIIEDRIIRMGGSKGRMSFVVESLGPGAVHYSFDAQNILTKVEVVSSLEGDPDRGFSDGKETVSVSQCICVPVRK